MGNEFLLIRHATTDLEGRLCGQLDPSLNAAGKIQLARLVDQLRNTRIERLYASDLKRANETARGLAVNWDVPIISRQDLREISFGEWEGKRWSEVREQTGGAFLESLESVSPPGGESFTLFRNRVLRALDEIVSASGDAPTAIVAHLGVIRIALSQFPSSGNADSPPRIEYCGIYQFVRSGLNLSFAGRLSATAADSEAPDPEKTQPQK